MAGTLKEIFEEGYSFNEELLQAFENRKIVFADMFGKPGNSGSPIIDSENHKVIGLYWGGIKFDNQIINCFSPIDIIWNVINNK